MVKSMRFRKLPLFGLVQVRNRDHVSMPVEAYHAISPKYSAILLKAGLYQFVQQTTELDSFAQLVRTGLRRDG